MSKINGLADALAKASADVLGNAENGADAMTVYGLSARIDNIVGTDADTAETSSIIGITKRIDNIVGTEEDDATQKTIYGLLAKIAELEARINELHPPVEEETPTT